MNKKKTNPLPKILRTTTVPQTLHTLIKHQTDFLKEDFNFIMASGPSDQKDTDYGQLLYTYYLLPLTRNINPLKDIKAIFHLYKILKKEKPLIIHSHTPKAGLVSMVAGYLAKVPIRFHTIAGMPLETQKGIKKSILLSVEKITYALANQVMPNSYGMMNFLNENKLVSNKKIKILGHGGSLGIDATFYNRSNISILPIQKKLSKKLKISEEDIICCFVGRVTKQKGVIELIEAFEEIFKLYSNVKLYILGRMENHLDALPQEYQQKIQNHPQIFYFGYQKDIRPYLSLSHIFVFPSHREGLPNVVLQAAAMELPCVVTDISGSNEIIQENINGKIVPPNDKKALKNAILFLIRNPEIRNNMASQTRMIVTSKYDKKIILEDLKNEYNHWLRKYV